MSSISKTKAELRKFGLVMAAAFLVLSLILIWRETNLGYYLGVVAVMFLVFGMLMPNLLGPVERIWMAFAEKLSVVMTTLIMFVLFYAMITPIGLLLKLLGKDLLALKLDKEQPSYWVKTEENGPASRPYLPY